MDNREPGRNDLNPWRVLAGVSAGVAVTVAVYGFISFFTRGYLSFLGDGDGALVVVVLVWAVGAVVVGALAGRVAGRLEGPVALGSGVLGLIFLGFMPVSFADPVILLFSGIFFLMLVLTGGALVFFARRTDLR